MASDFVILANYPSKLLLSINDDAPSDLLMQCVSLRRQVIQKDLFIGEYWHIFGRFKWRGTLNFSFWRTVTNFGGTIFVFARHGQIIENWLSRITRVKLVNMKMPFFVDELIRRHRFPLTLRLRSAYVFVELAKTLHF